VPGSVPAGQAPAAEREHGGSQAAVSRAKPQADQARRALAPYGAGGGGVGGPKRPTEGCFDDGAPNPLGEEPTAGQEGQHFSEDVGHAIDAALGRGKPAETTSGTVHDTRPVIGPASGTPGGIPTVGFEQVLPVLFSLGVTVWAVVQRFRGPDCGE